MKRWFGCRTVALAGCLALATGATADPIPLARYRFEAPPERFGQLDKDDTDCPRQSCGPVAAADGFVWLQKQWADVYGARLVADGHLAKTANALLGADYMNTDCRIVCAHGTYWEEFLYGQAKWIEEKAAGKTAYGAQTKFEWGRNYTLPEARKDKAVLENVSGHIALQEGHSPEWGFLYYSLKAGKAVEFLITFGDESGHYLTLYSFDWSDNDADGIVDESENAKLGFIDSTPDGLMLLLGDAHFWQDARDGPLRLDYVRGADARRAEITFAMRVAALPEPGIGAVLGIGLFALASSRRR